MLNDFFDLPKTNRLLTFLNNIATPAESIEPRTNIEKALCNISRNVANKDDIANGTLNLYTDESDEFIPITGDDLANVLAGKITGVFWDGAYFSLITIMIEGTLLSGRTYFGLNENDGVLSSMVIYIATTGNITYTSQPISYTPAAYSHMVYESDLQSIYPQFKQVLDQAAIDIVDGGYVSISTAVMLYSRYKAAFGVWYPTMSFTTEINIGDDSVYGVSASIQLNPDGFVMYITLKEQPPGSVLPCVVYFTASSGVVGTFIGTVDL